MGVSARGGGADDTRAKAAPLTKPSQPTRLVAVRSRWQSAGKKKLGNPLGWLGYWLADPGQPLKNQAQIELLEVTARLTQWLMP